MAPNNHIVPWAGPPRGKAGGDNDPGPMEFREPIGFRKAVGFGDSEDLFFFGDHLILAGKNV